MDSETTPLAAVWPVEHLSPMITIGILLSHPEVQTQGLGKELRNILLEAPRRPCELVRLFSAPICKGALIDHEAFSTWVMMVEKHNTVCSSPCQPQVFDQSQ